MTTLRFALKCKPNEALEALATLALVKSADELVDDARFDRHGELVSAAFPWLQKGNSQHSGWDNTVHGQIAIEGDQLTIEVNSQERADAIKRKIARRLGKRAVFRNAVIQSSEKMLEEIAQGRAGSGVASARQSNEELQALPEVQEKLREFAAQHWKTWVDIALPALQGKTPREAAKTASGRERLEAVFLQFEHHGETPQPFSPDVPALRRELGLE